jgi:RHS repeat-associated protein
LNRLSSEHSQFLDGSESVISYEYDAVSNRLAMHQSGIGTTTYEYDVNDRLTSRTFDGKTTTMSYDARGSLLSEVADDRIVTNSWNQDARLVSTRVVGASESTESHVYDWQGNRMATQRQGETEKYLVDTTQRVSRTLVSYNSDGLIFDRTYGVNVISEATASGVEVIHTDRYGSVRFVTDFGGEEVAALRYDAYGNILVGTGAINTDLAFSGEARSKLTGYDYLRNRYYAPADGRFLSTDPLIGSELLPIAQHRYVYGNADPINANDPLGLKSEYTLAGVLSAISIITSVSSIVFDLAGYKKTADTLFYISLFTGFGEIGLFVRGATSAASAASATSRTVVKATATKTSAQIAKYEGFEISSRVALDGYEAYNATMTGVRSGALKNLDETIAFFANSVKDLPLRREIAEWAANRILAKIESQVGKRLNAAARQSWIDIAQGIGGLARTL